MKDFNKDNFNNSIRKKFAQAEVQPGNGVWEAIEADLLKQDNRRMQKRAAFYRNLAAAVIFIALISIYFNLQDFTIGNKNSTQTSIIPIELNDDNAQLTVSDNDIVVSQPEAGNKSKSQFVDNGRQNRNQFALIGDKQNQNKKGAILVAKNDNFDNELNQIFVPKSSNSIASLDKLDSRTPMDFKLPEFEIEVNEVTYFAVSEIVNKEKSGLSWNTNLNLGSGNFNPNSEITETPVFSTVSSLNNPGTSGRTTAEFMDVVNEEREAVENSSSAPMEGSLSFTFGVNFGVLLNERWNIRSGVQYGSYRSSSMSSTVLRDRNSDELYPYHGASSSTEISDGRVVNVTSEYDLYNDFQIFTVPLMASYKIIDRKFDVSLVAGLSADVIVSNTLKGATEKINEVRFDRKDRQSYKNMFASSLAGLEISYPFSEKYAVSVMPTYKRALSNITSENATFNSTPSFVGLNMSLNYMF
ncbi:outer membrane beta-barrel protein [Marivirga arenosa]|uniref:Outer membrane beta-barrel protein n=1 Tax=Marivirga arenosa TaxID=3059076 RepID=A0AA51ZX13_9BACT|nr:outer membrane beta-barrel protein [Marivirga sp. BKB1-2]WNB18287.1 outer membrane beta-barrel protein [Marivirga sp. BKB1-2]